MEQQVRKELKDLCLNILRDEDPASTTEHLTQVQMLYEKLLVLNYLNEGKKKAESRATPDAPSPITNTELETTPEQKSVQSDKTEKETFSEPKPPKAQDEIKTEEKAEESTPIINESPVPEKELEDDKTPEQQSTPNERPIHQRSASINDQLNKGAIKVGLNDRIAFVKHLFSGSQEDFNRVLSQVNTFEEYEEAENFIENMIKPDYDWSQKEEYEMRFMDLVKGKFGVTE